VVSRRGITKLGCLIWLLIVTAIGYFGLHFGEAYYRYLQYKQAMDAEVRFRSFLPDERIIKNLKAQADSIGLPDDAKIITIKRDNGRITIEAHYEETIELPGKKKDIHFEPKASGTY
jgi:hypothetical protein